MSTVIGMNHSLSLDASGVKWPFAPQRHPVAQRPAARPAPAAASGVGCDVATSVERGSNGHGTSGEATAGSKDRMTAIHEGDSSAMLQSLHIVSGSHAGLGTGGVAQVTRRQMIGDVALVAVWAAMIPGMLWLGHVTGF